LLSFEKGTMEFQLVSSNKVWQNAFAQYFDLIFASFDLVSG